MFFFGLASNFITLSVLGIFSVIFLYQGVKDVTHISNENEASEYVILEHNIQQNISTTDFQLTFNNAQTTQDNLLIYPTFILYNNYPDCVEALPETVCNQNSNRGPPSVA